VKEILNSWAARKADEKTNRPRQFDYKGALKKQLPIGSGEIESAHRLCDPGKIENPRGLVGRRKRL